MRRLLAVALLLACSCGPRKGPVPGDTYFWQLDSSTVDWGTDCSDATDFRASATPVSFSSNTYIVYKVSKDGHQAISQTCTAIDSSTCTASDGGIVYDIAGTDLTFTETTKAPISTTGCSLQQDATWTLTDEITTMSLNIDNILSLVDNPTACASMETNLKNRSPNHAGVTGCVVTFALTGKLR
jgi:hypothetical protein